MASEAGVEIRRKGAVAEVVLCHPKRRNAITYGMWCELAVQMEQLADDDSVRVAIVRGEGTAAFSAGADISEFGEWRTEPEKAAIYNEATHRGMDALEHFPKPTIAQIHGFCIGGGLEVALVCDIRLCSADSQFAITPARLGLGYDLHDTDLLVRRLGAQASREILFTARRYNATEAVRLGIASQIAADTELDALVSQFTDQIVANAPLTIKASKALITQALKPESDRDIALCDRLIRDCYTSDDYKEGQRAFTEKRQPEFKGR